MRFPTKGQAHEKSRADLKVDLAYHTEYRNAAKMAASEDAPISVAPNAPS